MAFVLVCDFISEDLQTADRCHVDGEYSEDDVVSMLEAGQGSGELQAEGKKMITSIFAFDDMLAYRGDDSADGCVLY